MAIKPTDCILKISDVIVGEEESDDRMIRSKPIYAKFFDTFADRSNLDRFRGYIQLNDAFKKAIAKHGGAFKQTKNWDDCYIKFDSPEALTMFILKHS